MHARTTRLIENTPRAVFLALLAVLILAPAARAGITEPVPNLKGAAHNTTRTRFSTTGVINSSDFGTYFTCTSTWTMPQDIAVEVYDPAGNAQNDPIATRLTFQPGETKMFATTGVPGFDLDENLNLGAIPKGSARILSTSTGLVCSAFTANISDAPATGLVSLPLFHLTTEKGE